MEIKEKCMWWHQWDCVGVNSKYETYKLADISTNDSGTCESA
jgi:hypothetical protein